MPDDIYQFLNVFSISFIIIIYSFTYFYIHILSSFCHQTTDVAHNQITKINIYTNPEHLIGPVYVNFPSWM